METLLHARGVKDCGFSVRFFYVLCKGVGEMVVIEGGIKRARALRQGAACFAVVVVAVLAVFFAGFLGACTPKAPQQSAQQGAGTGGQIFYDVFSTEPASLHPISSNDVYSRQIQAKVLDTLMVQNPDTYEWEPAVAERFEESEAAGGQIAYTFYLRKGVVFHDGKPVGAEDIKFSFDAIKDPAFKGFALMPYYENIASATVVDAHTVRFDTKEKYFNNFNVLAGLYVLPQHYYGDPKKKLNKTLLGSGPYKLGEYKKGQHIRLDKNEAWWGFKDEAFADYHKMGALFYRFIKSATVQLESLKKGRIDFMALRPEDFVQKASGPMWEQGPKGEGPSLVKVQAQNLTPKSYGFVGWNFKRPLFQDRKTRVALAHLMNREMMNKKFRFGMSLLATGPWYRQSPYANPSVKPLGFDPVKAKKLLKQSGWQDTNKNGILDKMLGDKRKEFSFTLIFSNKDTEKYYTTYQQDLKKAGIDMRLKLLDWNTFIKLLDDQKFDAVSLGWGAGSVDNDPKQIWHTESAQKGGSNFISYSNPEVDALIDKGRAELDRKKRIDIYRKIYKKIAFDAPYAWMFVNRYDLYAHTGRVQKKRDTYRYAIGKDFWRLTN